MVVQDGKQSAEGGPRVDNVTAIILGVVILGAIGLDATMFDWGYSLFLFTKFISLIDELAFWR